MTDESRSASHEDDKFYHGIEAMPIQINIRHSFLEADQPSDDVCVWTECRGGTWEEEGYWDTSCGEEFCMPEEGTLEENNYRFCPNCGKPIHEVPLTQEAEE